MTTRIVFFAVISCSRHRWSSHPFPDTSKAMFPPRPTPKAGSARCGPPISGSTIRGRAPSTSGSTRPEGDNNQVESVVLTLTDPVTVLEDVVGATFGTTGVGSIHYLADGPVLVTSRTWTSAEPAGSYGQTITGVPVTDAAYPDGGQAGRCGCLSIRRRGSGPTSG